MGYRGKINEQNRARDLRKEGWKLQDIADELHVSKGSVSLWVRDVEFEPTPRRSGRRRAPNKLQIAKQEEIDRLRADGFERIGQLSEREFLVAGTALYAGEGGKTDKEIAFANSDARMIFFFVTWLRHFLPIDESRLKLRLYLHQGLDLDAAVAYWSELTRIPPEQFGKPYRAVPDPSIRKAKHIFGCPSVRYTCKTSHRTVMGLVAALLSCDLSLSGVAQSEERLTVNQDVVGSSPTPGAC